MTLAREILHGAAIGVGVADCADDLDVIARPGVAAALWQRRVDPDWQAWINGLAPETLPQLRVILRPGRVRDAVSDACDVAGLDASAARDWLIEDIGGLADRFAGLMRARFLRLRLDVIETDACRRFHIDAVTARLICTYRGTGTQYGISVDGEEPRRVFTTPTGAPLVLRGTLWPGDPPSGLLHRSPPIERSGETRLLLVLDPVDDPEEAI
ncbi:Protein of unknown function [Roseovarius tolerans]|uniref:DUF1826 domain-containing protein n=1 Tax=Roseovarius tolerans TaxID=74031 RepID=A0A1H7YUE0_9RHOB|nr:DUF1826 domain-containing protein [Roseovarius tolerans]SEM49535.1 Protein of unknown function [Roseovarius tolerans]